MVKTLQQLHTLLNGITGFSGKVAYHSWPENEAPALPFICYLEVGSDNFGADNRVYHGNRRVDIELYARKRDLTSEALIEAALTGAEIYFERTVEWLDDEKCFKTTYEIEV